MTDPNLTQADTDPFGSFEDGASSEFDRQPPPSSSEPLTSPPEAESPLPPPPTLNTSAGSITMDLAEIIAKDPTQLAREEALAYRRFLESSPTMREDYAGFAVFIDAYHTGSTSLPLASFLKMRAATQTFEGEPSDVLKEVRLHAESLFDETQKGRMPFFLPTAAYYLLPIDRRGAMVEAALAELSQTGGALLTNWVQREELIDPENDPKKRVLPREVEYLNKLKSLEAALDPKGDDSQRALYTYSLVDLGVATQLHKMLTFVPSTASEGDENTTLLPNLAREKASETEKRFQALLKEIEIEAAAQRPRVENLNTQLEALAQDETVLAYTRDRDLSIFEGNHNAPLMEKLTAHIPGLVKPTDQDVETVAKQLGAGGASFRRLYAGWKTTRDGLHAKYPQLDQPDSPLGKYMAISAEKEKLANAFSALPLKEREVNRVGSVFVGSLCNVEQAIVTLSGKLDLYTSPSPKWHETAGAKPYLAAFEELQAVVKNKSRLPYAGPGILETSRYQAVFPVFLEATDRLNASRKLLEGTLAQTDKDLYRAQLDIAANEVAYRGKVQYANRLGQDLKATQEQLTEEQGRIQNLNLALAAAEGQRDTAERSLTTQDEFHQRHSLLMATGCAYDALAARISQFRAWLNDSSDYKIGGD